MTRIGPKLSATFSRIQAIHWEQAGDEADEDIGEWVLAFVANMHELAVWLKLKLVDPFTFNFALHICSDLEVPPVVEEWLDNNEARIRPWRGRERVACLLFATFSWAHMVDVYGVLVDAPLIEPYEPIIQFFELGGGIYVEHGGLVVEVYPGRSPIYMYPRVGTESRRSNVDEP